MIDKLPYDLGIVAFALDGGFDKPDAHSLVDKVNQLEIPGKRRFIELLVMPSTDIQQIADIARVIDSAGYGITICGFRPGADAPDMMSPDENIVKGAIEEVEHIMRCAEAAGAKRIGGPWYRNHMNLTEKDKDHPNLGQHFESALRRVAELAGNKNLYMCMEMLNYWEMAGCNTVRETLPLVRRINSPNLLIHLDPAHSSREEPCYVAAASEVFHQGKLGHVHISENGRGPIGAGPVSDKLYTFMHNLATWGYGDQGEVAIVEVFHPSMYGSVRRVDNFRILQQSREVQDQWALTEAMQSFAFIRNAYQRVCETMVPR